jgi:nitrate/TMAO reductase-like tetraheme cytochrome c subunit
VASFNFKFPDNKDCLACHEREDDRHPVYRFNEPRFIEARQAIQPQFCVSCHKEHTGVRVSSDPENCKFCHQKLKMKEDPLDISHFDLIKLKNWDTCLACHDFHGDHVMKTPTNTKDMLDQQQIKNYMAGGKDPYSDKKRTQYRQSRYEN